MTHIKYKWNFPKPVPVQVENELNDFSPAFRSILYQRGCRTSQEAVAFLHPLKPDYPELSHVDLACQIITKALKEGRKIAVFGDYDTDGITATALLTLALRSLSAHVKPVIPHRIQDGYGLNKASLTNLSQEGYNLLITVDNGIRSKDEVAYAQLLGFQVIITDHHQPPEVLPDAEAIINPKLPGDPYPNKNLAGVGVVYQLICGLSSYFPALEPEQYLDLVALGTIADIVPLTGENRYLVKQGLSRINSFSRPALASLLGISGLTGRRITAADISFQIAPRINSSGRLGEDQYLAPLELLLSSKPDRFGLLSQIIEGHNDRRKQISREMQQRIESQFDALSSLPKILLSLDPEHDQGVAGITAGFLSRKYYLPAIVGKMGPDSTTASCRSIPEFDIIAALEANQSLFTQFGGHKLAAGFTIANERIPQLESRLASQAEASLSGLDLCPSLEIDATVDLSELGHGLYKELLKLEPTGEGNPTPIFALSGVRAKNISRVGAGKEHLKLTISDGKSSLPAIGFGLGELAETIPDRFSIACHFNENEFRGKKEFQLQILDLQAN